MSVKIYKRSFILVNLILFTLLSIFFLQITTSLKNGSSALEYASFIDLLKTNNLIIILAIPTLLTIFTAKRISEKFFIIFVTYISWQSIVLFFMNFDKIILVLDFIYIITAFTFFIFWKLELKEAIYVPKFDIHNIGPRSEYSLNIIVTNSKGKSFSGLLTNWSNQGCFANFDKLEKKELRGKITLKINFEERVFTQKGVIVTGHGDGFGIKFTSTNEISNTHTWREFYDIIADRGYTPRFSKV